MRHPKFLALNGNANSLWDEGKDYCDEHMTDGLIPHDAIKGFRFRGQKCIALLTASCGPKVDGTPYAPLWETHPVGFKMHDYLDYNPCREEAVAHMAAADTKNAQGRERMRRWRDRPNVTQDVTRNENVPLRTVVEKSTEVLPPNPLRGPSVADQAIADKAATFLDHYVAIYAKSRNNAFYRMAPARDHAYAMDLVKAWPDVDHLDKMAELFLRKVEWKPKNEPGTVGQFLHLAPQCDTLLRQHGHAPRDSKAGS